ncbi:MAG: hypothetical protein OER86_04885, partial [Phycisphaerae bacterium]|nr:hypothetical protein [Phycisphaerae bacterium]
MRRVRARLSASSRAIGSLAVLAICLALCPAAASGLQAQEPGPSAAVTAPPAAGEPIAADLDFSAAAANTWRENGRHWLLLDRDVHVEIGAYRYRAQAALVSLTPRPGTGGLAHEVAVYLDNV